MNLPSSFKEMTTKQYQLTATQRQIVIATVGIMTILITLYVTTPEVAVEPTLPMNNAPQATTIPSKLVIPTGPQTIPVSQVNQIMRDPFARPPEAKEQKNDTDRVLPSMQNNIPSDRSAMVPQVVVPTIPRENLKLTGIVGNAERRLAVIMLANKSQSYSLNEMIGTYKIVAINDNSVMLTNATGKLVLRFESAEQKGDHTNEK